MTYSSKTPCPDRVLPSTLHTSRCTLHSSESKLQTSHSTLHTPHFSLLTASFTLQTSHFTLHSPHFTLRTSQSTLDTSQFTVHTSHFALHSPHFTLRTSHFTLHISHFSLLTPHSTLHTRMRFITTHTQPSAVKRELKPLRQDLVCTSSQHQQTLVERTAQLPRDDGIVCGELRRPTLCRPTTYCCCARRF